MRDGGGGRRGRLSGLIPAGTDSQAHCLSLPSKILVLKSLLCVKSYLANTDEPEEMGEGTSLPRRFGGGFESVSVGKECGQSCSRWAQLGGGGRRQRGVFRCPLGVEGCPVTFFMLLQQNLFLG